MAGSVARIIEISSTSETSFEDAVKVGLQRASQTLRHLSSAWVKDHKVMVDGEGNVTSYQVHMLVTFVLE
ncbi:MAG TPA: dodecin family protein [Micromonosporaceae bacterium]